jgi:glycosyltransferase 2 family protein
MTRWLKHGLALLLLIALIWSTDPGQLFNSLAQITLPFLLLIILFSLLLVWLSVMKWAIILRSFGSSVSSWELGKLYLVGYFINSFLPSSVGGDVVRSWRIGRQVGQERSFAATIIDRFTGLVAMTALAFAVMGRSALANSWIKFVVCILALGLLSGFLFLSSDRLFRYSQSLPIRERFREPLLKVRAAFLEGVRNRTLFLQCLLWAFAFHAGTVMNTWATAHAVGWTDVAISDLFTVVPLILLVGNIPITPSNLGVMEGTFFLFLTSVGATPAEAVGIALLLRAKGYLLALFGGFCWLGLKEKNILEVRAIR